MNYSDLRCFKDDSIMLPVDEEKRPGWIFCPLCGLTTQMVGYNADAVAEDMRELWEDEIADKNRLSKKGGNSKGRKRGRPKPQPPAWYHYDRESG